MARTVAFSILLLAASVGTAQELVITNARIIDGTGMTIDRGSVVVTDGRITSVSSGDAEAPGEQIDARGMTVMPGLIDTHRHLGPQLPVLAELLARGITTIMVPSGALTEMLDLRRSLADGDVQGPRLITTGPGFTAPGDWPTTLCGSNDCAIHEVTDPAVAQARVRELADAGVDAIKVFYERSLVPEVRLEDRVLGAIAEEAHRQGIDVVLHVGTANELLTVVRLGADRLVHVPASGAIADSDGAQLLREAAIPVSTTVSWDSPAIQEASGEDPPPERAARLTQALANIRHLWDEGVIVAFGTDSPRPLGRTEFMVEVQELHKVLTPEEIVTAITRNAAIYLQLDEEIGTLEQGKIADMVIIDGNPLVDVFDLGNVEVVIQGGRVAVDNR